MCRRKGILNEQPTFDSLLSTNRATVPVAIVVGLNVSLNRTHRQRTVNHLIYKQTDARRLGFHKPCNQKVNKPFTLKTPTRLRGYKNYEDWVWNIYEPLAAEAEKMDKLTKSRDSLPLQKAEREREKEGTQFKGEKKG